MGEDQILHGELDIDDAAEILLEIEDVVIAARGQTVEHLLPHRLHFLAQFRAVAPLAENFAARLLEGGADGRIAGDAARPRQRLVFPQPGGFELILAEGRDGRNHQAGIAVRAQAQVGFEEDAGGGARGHPGVEARAELGVDFGGLGRGVVE